MRKRIYEIIEVAKKSDHISRIYDFFLIAVIIISIIPLITPMDYTATIAIQTFALVVFIGDYALRWMTADYKYKDHHLKSFLRYPFSPLAIVNLLVIISLLPVSFLGPNLAGVVDSFRVIRIFQVFRLSKYSKSINLILKVFRRQRRALLTVIVFAFFYILVTALAVYVAEPETFGNFFDAVYWSTTTLTTISSGDLYPISVIGRLVTIASSLFGILVVALPTGILTAGFVKVLNEAKKQQDSPEPAPPQFHLTSKNRK